MSTESIGIGLLATVGVSLPELVEFAGEAERAGFDDVWIVEYEYDSMAIAQAIAMSTERIRTGSCALRAFTRHPIGLAETAAIIDAFAPGRFMIGLGSGPTKPITADGGFQRWGLEWDKPAGRMRDYLRVLKRGLEGGTIEHDGRFYKFHNVTPDPIPTNPVPIWIAGGGPQMMRVAGAEADGLFLHMANREMIANARATVAAAAIEARRNPDDIRIGNLLMVCIDDNVEVARAAMRHWLVEFYLTLESYHGLLERAGYGEVVSVLKGALDRGDRAAAEEAVSDAVLDDFTITGTGADCRARLEEFIAWGIDNPILYPFPAQSSWLETYRATIAAVAVARD